MSRSRFVALLVAAAVAISVAFYFNARRNQSGESMGLILFPGLAAELNAVNTVTLQSGAATPTVTLHKSGEAWTVAERADYPADLAKLRKLLISLSDAKIIEEKTSDPQRYAAVGVEDPAAGSSAVAIMVTSPAAKRSLIVGKPVAGGNFVRKPGERQSYSVEPEITADAEPRRWVDPRLLNIAASQIKQIDVQAVGGSDYSIRRTEPAAPDKAPANTTAAGNTGSAASAAPDKSPTKPGSVATAATAAAAATGAPASDSFSLQSAPAGRKAAASDVLANSANALSALDVEDVAPVSSIDFSQASHATVRLADGSLLTLTGVIAGDKHWIQVASSTDSALTKKGSGRAFEIASYRYDGIFKPLEQVLVPKEVPSPAARPSRAAKPSSSPSSSPSPSTAKKAPLNPTHSP